MTDPLDYSGKTVLIVGGTSGIGNGMAHAFRGRGAIVHVTGTRASASDYDGVDGSDLDELTFHSLDVAKRGAVEAMDWPPSLDVVILCQGIARYKRAEFAQAGWDEVIQVNLNSLMDCARAFHDALADAKGSLIIVSSVGAYHALVGNPAYGASKAGAVSFVKSLAVAWAADGIRVNGIAPGYVYTKINSAFLDDDKIREHEMARIPVRRLGTPEDMAGAALYLGSPLASYVIGQTISVDGGMTLAG